ncbi:MAG: gamma-glutamyltransferase [Rhodospirillaceae bacterium]|jgi:gamma-glutamyltranspeptidase/glutathione hydrolase|nr:gamma-glutamyltransferase [Rhodospirillaceae bacterium]MBT3494978.1 gamma-glutamyltransferase [Rhodospirillaceae bacterium]MBT3783309.1 gamma-glutamyltransferase [Rhodospirillaceae bacterium]MBT3975764.1 gamma-glutamyltransferase [Rhodospirillaceae bacterium]MBT4168540.1 gamma-glutamyltransferase [Rhodospirillaceae bacterium]
MTRRLCAALFLLPLLFCALGVQAQSTAILSNKDRHHAVHAANGMVASQEARATKVGVEVLRQGGNAIDAAVAVGFTLAVTLPRAGNLGGGGFMLLHHAASAETLALDYREKAPAKAHRDLYLDSAGNVDKARARFSHQSVGVPGTVAGLIAAHRRFGTLPLAAVMAPAIVLAEQGLTVTPSLARNLGRRQRRLSKWPASAAIFYKPGGALYQAGETLVQKDLAASLRRIAATAGEDFYTGDTARAITGSMARNGGLITLADLAAYRPVWRQAVRGSYRGFQIAAMPPPSSGGVHLIQMLNMLEQFPLAKMGHNGADSLHLMAEAMKLAYADRAEHLGDPDFWSVPIKGLTSKAYARSLAASIDPDQARASAQIRHGAPAPYESNETTHYSVMDGAGNVVSNTYTLNFSFGTGIVVPGTGILLNNEMDDFSAKPGVPNAFGLVGGEANAIQGGKRPLSSMTPTIVFKDGQPLLATGSPGGSRIITMVMQILLNVIDHNLNIAEATAAPRIHHQWRPDKLWVEQGVGPDTLAILRRRGHVVTPSRAAGSVQSVMRVAKGGGFLGASDPRSPGALSAGY